MASPGELELGGRSARLYSDQSSLFAQVDVVLQHVFGDRLPGDRVCKLRGVFLPRGTSAFEPFQDLEVRVDVSWLCVGLAGGPIGRRPGWWTRNETIRTLAGLLLEEVLQDSVPSPAY